MSVPDRFELSTDPARPGTDLVRRSTKALAMPVIIRPPSIYQSGESWSVVVEAVEPIGADASIRCRDRIRGVWSFECQVFGRVPSVGDLGTVRCSHPYRTLPIRWTFEGEGGADALETHGGQ